eukprot:1152408-Pelagomonas_calceolata.AAC.1
MHRIERGSHSFNNTFKYRNLERNNSFGLALASNEGKQSGTALTGWNLPLTPSLGQKPSLYVPQAAHGGGADEPLAGRIPDRIRSRNELNPGLPCWSAFGTT